MRTGSQGCSWVRNWPVNMTLQSLANLFLGHRINRGEGRVKYFPDVLIKSLLKCHFHWKLMNCSHNLGHKWGSFWVILILLRYVEGWQHPHHWTLTSTRLSIEKLQCSLVGLTFAGCVSSCSVQSCPAWVRRMHERGSHTLEERNKYLKNRGMKERTIEEQKDKLRHAQHHIWRKASTHAFLRNEGQVGAPSHAGDNLTVCCELTAVWEGMRGWTDFKWKSNINLSSLTASGLVSEPKEKTNKWLKEKKEQLSNDTRRQPIAI